MKILDRELGSVNVQIKDLYFLGNCSNYQREVYQLLDRNNYKAAILKADDIYYLKFSSVLDIDLIMSNDYIVDFDDIQEMSLADLCRKIHCIEKKMDNLCKNYFRMCGKNLIMPISNFESLKKDTECSLALMNNMVNDYMNAYSKKSSNVLVKR